MKPVQHGVAYFLGNGLTMLASVVSLVVLTRFFDAAGYGLLNLVVVTITALATLAGCGLPQDDPKQRCPDITKARQLLDWQPNVPFEDGLRRTIPWFVQTLHSASASLQGK